MLVCNNIISVTHYIVPGGSLSNLSCLSDNDSSSCKGNNKNKKSRSSVSSRSREGGSLPPTKFENVMLYETANNSSNFACPCAWDTGPLGSPAAQVCHFFVFIFGRKVDRFRDQVEG